jgi:Ca2+-transporting ATPase
LTTEEAKRRLSSDGANELPAHGRRDLIGIFRDVAGEPMFALLLIAAVVYFALGDLSEAIVLCAFATFSVSIALVQEIRSERVLDALREMTSPRALVVRDGEKKRIAGREVVREDLIILREGDRVPADAWVLSGDDFSVDESLLTGESAPVRKRAAPKDEPRTIEPGGEDTPAVFSGTLVVRGQAEARVIATGAGSAIGKIGSALAGIQTETPRLRRETARIVRIFGIVGASVALVAGTLYGLAQASWIEGLLSGIAVGMTMLPEEFPLVLVVFMVMGAWRIAQARVLTRRAASIQTLGAVTVLCTDKTGTLTMNRMEVAHLEANGEQWQVDHREPSESIRRLIHIAALAGMPDPFDPMERAIQTVMRDVGHEPDALFAERELAHSQGITPELLAMIQIWRETGRPTVAATKGAPEAVLSLCGVTAAERDRVLARTSELAAQGTRVLAVAEGEVADGAAMKSVAPGKFSFVGLIGFRDPVRESVPDAVRECAAAGIRVVMITGDYPETARAIAKEAGLNASEILTGGELKALDDETLRARLRTCDVFARILPDQKLRIVELLKANGEIVGMTGDGVNDAPSLRAAHIGIAMGGRGTDVAREASSIVLLDDDFGSIVKTIRLGRRIYDNLQKAMGFISAVHIPIAGLALLPLVFGAPPILTPAIVAFLEMVIDPACSIVFEAEPAERNIMNRPPRDPGARLLHGRLLTSSAVQGALALLGVAALYVVVLVDDRPVADIRALMLVTITMVNIALIFSHRSLGASIDEIFGRWNAWLWFGLAGVAAILALTLSIPPVRELFRLGALQPIDVGMAAVTSIVLTLVLLVFKNRRTVRH